MMTLLVEFRSLGFINIQGYKGHKDTMIQGSRIQGYKGHDNTRMHGLLVSMTLGL